MGGIVETVVFCTSRELVLCGGFLATEGPMAVIKVLGFGHIYIYIYVLCVCIYANLCTCTCVCIYENICMCVHIYMCMYMNVRTYIYIYIYISRNRDSRLRQTDGDSLETASVFFQNATSSIFTVAISLGVYTSGFKWL